MIRWQRDFGTPPPPISADDPRHPRNDPRYAELDAALLPNSESLADTLARLLPCWNESIVPALTENKTVLIVAHHNTLRALLKHLEDIPPRAMLRVRVPIARPLIFELDASLRPQKKYYLETPVVPSEPATQ
jgi:2,3-bisphosphoglycerate-dependent phosphoglycerate mutase